MVHIRDKKSGGDLSAIDGVQKKIGYIVNQGKGLVIPDMIIIERRANETLKDVTSGQRTTISNIGLDMINKDLKGYHDAALGTIVFNERKIPKTDCCLKLGKNVNPLVNINLVPNIFKTLGYSIRKYLGICFVQL